MMDSGLLSLKWNNHGSTFFHVLSSIRKKESYTDVTITCGGKFYPVHKLVLSTCSEYFEEIFERTQCKHPVIVLKDIKHEELEALLNYMYLGEVNVLQAELAGLINAAECLKIKGLAVPDEAPLIKSDSSRENKRSAKDSSSSNSGPHHKRSRHEEEIRLSPSNSSQSFRSHHKESSREPRTSSTQSAAEPGFTSPSYRSPNQTSEGTRERRAAAEAERLNDSYSKKGNSTSNSSHPIHPIHPIEEVIVEDTPTVKEEIEEPKEEEEEEVINSDSSLAYDTLAGTGMGNDGDGPNMFKQHMSAGPQDIEDLVAQSLPGPSSQQGESLMGWAGGGGANSGGFSLEGFPLEDSSQGGPAGATQGGQQMVLESWGQCELEGSGSSNRLLTCQVCGYCTPRRDLLNNHLRIHTGEKPFKCPSCTYQSADRSNLRRHMKVTHKDGVGSSQVHSEDNVILQAINQIQFPPRSSFDI